MLGLQFLDKILVRAIRKAAGKEATSAWIADAGETKAPIPRTAGSN
jgi:hypothetical protein